MRTSDGGIGRITAHSAGVSFGKSDIATLSPSCSPRVLDSPKVISFTDQKDSVVNRGSAAAQNTRSVGRPD